MSLAGSAIIVTGGGSGIGEAIVRLFAAEGAHVVIADCNERRVRMRSRKQRSSWPANNPALLQALPFP